MALKTWFTMKTEEGFEDVLMTDKMIGYSFDGEFTLVSMVDGKTISYPGDQRRKIGLAIGKIYSEKDLEGVINSGAVCRSPVREDGQVQEMRHDV